MIAVEATIARMEPADKSPALLMTARDIAEKKRIEAQARMQQEQLLAGLQEFKVGNNFGYSAFVA
mgnify:CR=1 FL=1